MRNGMNGFFTAIHVLTFQVVSIERLSKGMESGEGGRSEKRGGQKIGCKGLREMS